jgi:hypothetical protein
MEGRIKDEEIKGAIRNNCTPAGSFKHKGKRLKERNNKIKEDKQTNKCN